MHFYLFKCNLKPLEHILGINMENKILKYPKNKKVFTSVVMRFYMFKCSLKPLEHILGISMETR